MYVIHDTNGKNCMANVMYGEDFEEKLLPKYTNRSQQSTHNLDQYTSFDIRTSEPTEKAGH